jgi:hypothetical protein
VPIKGPEHALYRHPVPESDGEREPTISEIIARFEGRLLGWLLLGWYALNQFGNAIRVRIVGTVQSRPPLPTVAAQHFGSIATHNATHSTKGYSRVNRASEDQASQWSESLPGCFRGPLGHSYRSRVHAGYSTSHKVTHRFRYPDYPKMA